MQHRLAVLFLVAVVATTACGGGGDSTDASDDAAAGEVTVTVASSDLGDILADGENRTLYLFLNDEQGASVCYDDCAQNWPPLTGAAAAGAGLDESLLGSVERDDGTTQVTYADWPLYYFAADAEPGDTNGQGVGDVWYVVDPVGEPVEAAAADSEERSY